ncbi:MAG: porphobilinogen synthase [Rubripirellula sp.]
MPDFARGPFPSTRMRRQRSQDWSRRLVQETTLTSSDLIWPLFVVDQPESEAVPSLPGVNRIGSQAILETVEQACKVGIPAIAIFPVTESSLKTEDALEATNPDNLVCRTVRAIKESFGDDIGVICDVALDPYSSHGQDGLMRDGIILNDETIAVLCQQAIIQSDAGCDIIAPSDMMDGRIGEIRDALDDQGHHTVQIMSYAAKYASSFYGPFRDAVGSSGNLGSGDKKTYQQSPSQTDEALHEVALDLLEGADSVMIKPGMPYLDILQRVKETFKVPTFVYQVSGEYAMLCAASEKGWLNKRATVMESLLAFKRAGADGILTYFAAEVATWLQEQD